MQEGVFLLEKVFKKLFKKVLTVHKEKTIIDLGVRQGKKKYEEMVRMQKMTSANTSINKGKLPASTKKINWEQYRGQKALDIGGGKFDNLKDHLKAEYDIDLYIYDKFNRTAEENVKALSCEPQVVICNNVLNVIDANEVVEEIVARIVGYTVCFDADAYVSVYEGDKTGKGRVTKKDCYQRNERLTEYLKFFKRWNVESRIEKGMIRL